MCSAELASLSALGQTCVYAELLLSVQYAETVERSCMT
jgi:hypothetical protein